MRYEGREGKGDGSKNAQMHFTMLGSPFREMTPLLLMSHCWSAFAVSQGATAISMPPPPLPQGKFKSSPACIKMWSDEFGRHHETAVRTVLW